MSRAPPRPTCAAAAHGSGQRGLTRTEAYGDSPDWSPDGKRIAFIRLRGTSWVYVMNADGSGQTNLTRHEDVNDSEPAWRPR